MPAKHLTRNPEDLIPHQTLSPIQNADLSEEAKSRGMCIADTFARRIGVLTDPAALARILYDYDKIMNVRGRPPRET
jgi:hypothetical protein